MDLEFMARRLDLRFSSNESYHVFSFVQAFRHRLIYFIPADIADVNPEVATIGSVTFARFAV